MRQLPLPVRVATGLAVSAAEHVKDLPRQVTGLPITLASQALQLAMRVQQQVTELAIKGDDALATLQASEDTPSWATFDEDVDSSAPFEASPVVAAVGQRNGDRAHTNGRYAGSTSQPAEDSGALGSEAIGDPWAEEERAMVEGRQAYEDEFGARSEQHDAARSVESAGAADPAASVERSGGPSWLPNYDSLSLPQVRARLRTFSEEQLAELLDHERTHANRSSFVGMLSRRISNVRRQSGRDDETDQSV